MGLVRSVWRGEIHLWITYWIWGVGGNMSFVAVLAALWMAGIGGEWLWLVYFLSLGWFVLVFGGIWRSAGRYEGPRFWAALARLGVTAGVLRMAAEAALLVTL